MPSLELVDEERDECSCGVAKKSDAWEGAQVVKRQKLIIFDASCQKKTPSFGGAISIPAGLSSKTQSIRRASTEGFCEFVTPYKTGAP